MVDDKEQVPAAGGGPTQEDSKDKAAAEDTSEPTETEKPKKKLILKPEDRINLGKQLEPLLKPQLESLVQQLNDAKDREEKQAEKANNDKKTITENLPSSRS